MVTALPAELKTVIDDIRKPPTPEERAAASLRWVQSEVRYFSVSFGESSHRPYAPAEVIARRYGDCKDKSYLLSPCCARSISRPGRCSSRCGNREPHRCCCRRPMRLTMVIVEATIDGRSYYLDGTRFAQPVPLAALAPPMPRALALAADARATALAELPVAPSSQASAEPGGTHHDQEL